ncbi:MAG: chemotaxis-specific protein-glutamate methyltransferase CheB [Pseudomonadota bacterium]
MFQTAIRNDPPGQAGRGTAVLIVDDSAVARAALGRIVESGSEMHLAGAADSAHGAIAWLKANTADVILLDLEMPGLDGLAALPELIAAGNGARILIVSSTAREGAENTLRALALGAADTLAKPEAGGLNQTFGLILIDRIRRLGRATRTALPLERHTLRTPATTPVELLAIGASTGGLRALAEFFEGLPRAFDAPILITQHLPPAFMPYFAEQLSAMAGRFARVASEGEIVGRGEILVAPGERHLRVVDHGDQFRVVLSDAVAETRCCPSVDPMFEAVAEAAGRGAVAVVLTGMGRDGSSGARRIVARGGSVIAQDQGSSTVWGMPGSVVRDGLASMLGTPAQLARHITARGSA